jgi:hypothetical protein
MMISPISSIMTNAISRFDKAGRALLGAVSMGGEGAPEAIGAMIEAKAQFQAGVSVVRLSDDMLRELLDVVSNDR